MDCPPPTARDTKRVSALLTGIAATFLCACSPAPAEAGVTSAPPASAATSSAWPVTQQDEEFPLGVMSPQQAAPESEFAHLLTLFTEAEIARGAYEADQRRWRRESNAAHAKASTRAAMGVRAPQVTPTDPELRLSSTLAREAYQQAYGQLSPEERQQFDALLAEFARNPRSALGASGR